MSEAEIQEHKPKVSKLALASIVVVLAGLLILCIFIECGRSWSILAPESAWHGFILLILLIPIFSLILGIIALCMIHKNKAYLNGRSYAISAICLSLPAFIVHFFFLCPLVGYSPMSKSVRFRNMCGSNLKGFSTAIQVYRKDNHQYPEVNKWCDLLIDNGYMNENDFVCPIALKTGNKSSSHYAMNPDCGPNSPNDMVLLFETIGGWNQFGGLELLTAENHDGKGSHILFNDCHVDFVSVRGFNDLKWK